MLGNDEIEKETSESTDLVSFNINKGESKYKFMIKSDEVKIELTIVKQEQKNKSIKFYKKILDLNDIKLLHKNFAEFTCYQEFSKYLKNQNEKNNLEIFMEYDDLISIKLKEENISLDFIEIKPNLDLIKNYFYEENCDLRTSIIELKENKKLNEEINELKFINKKLKEDNEKIIKDLKIIKEEIEKLKKKNEDKQNISNKTNQLEIKLNKNSSTRGRIISINPIKINNNILMKRTKSNIGKIPSEATNKTILNSSKDRKSNQIKSNKKNKSDNLNAISEKIRKNDDSINGNKNYNSKGTYNKEKNNMQIHPEI